MSFRSVHIVSDIDDQFGGPSVAVPALAAALRELAIDSVILSVKTRDNEQNRIVDDKDLLSISAPRLIKGGFYYAPDMFKLLETQIEMSTVPLVHLHSIWRFPGYVAQTYCDRAKIPLLTSLHSNLYRASLSRSAWKKALARYCYVDKIMSQSLCLHATEPGELEAVRSLGITTPVALIPLGVETNRFDNLPSRGDARAELGLPPDRRYLLFLSRVHPRKGVDALLDAFVDLALWHPEWDLIIAGPEGDADLSSRLRATARLAGIEDRVHFTGMLRGDAIRNAYAASDVFVLPSWFENFGIAIAEALSAGLPVIVSDRTPWSEVNAARAGYCGPVDPERLRLALEQFMRMSDEERAERGRLGKKLISGRTWAHAGEQFAAMYRWALGQGERPAFVHV